MAWLPPAREDRSRDQPERPCGFGIQRQRLEGGLGVLQDAHPARPLGRVVSVVRPRRQLSEGYRTNDHHIRQVTDVEAGHVYDYVRINQATPVTLTTHG
jgi:hypothetical protein